MSTLERQCKECGASYTAKRESSEFCCVEHRKRWNNRRMLRGADLYDGFMAMRYRRGLAQQIGLYALLCKLASAWNDEDKKANEGRGLVSFTDNGEDLVARLKR